MKTRVWCPFGYGGRIKSDCARGLYIPGSGGRVWLVDDMFCSLNRIEGIMSLSTNSSCVTLLLEGFIQVKLLLKFPNWWTAIADQLHVPFIFSQCLNFAYRYPLFCRETTIVTWMKVMMTCLVRFCIWPSYSLLLGTFDLHRDYFYEKWLLLVIGILNKFLNPNLFFDFGWTFRDFLCGGHSSNCYHLTWEG